MMAVVPLARVRVGERTKQTAFGPSRLIDGLHARGVLGRMPTAPKPPAQAALASRQEKPWIDLESFVESVTQVGRTMAGARDISPVAMSTVAGATDMGKSSAEVELATANPTCPDVPREYPDGWCHRHRQTGQDEPRDHQVQGLAELHRLPSRRVDGSRSSGSETHARDVPFESAADAPSRSSGSCADPSRSPMATLRERNRGLRGKLKESESLVAELTLQLQELRVRAERAEAAKVESEAAKVKANVMVAQSQSEAIQLREQLQLCVLRVAVEANRSAALCTTSQKATERTIACLPTPGKARAGAASKAMRAPVAKTNLERPRVPVFHPPTDPAVRLRQMQLPPKRLEDNIEIPNPRHDDDDDDEGMASSQEQDQLVPKWCDSFLEVLVAQDNLDPDTIFGAKVPACNMDVIFPPELYHEIGLAPVKRKRGSSGEWHVDRLARDEVQCYKVRMGHTECWDTLMEKPPVDDATFVAG